MLYIYKVYFRDKLSSVIKFKLKRLREFVILAAWPPGDISIYLNKVYFIMMLSHYPFDWIAF